MQLDRKKRNLYLTAFIIIAGLVFMAVTGFYITSGVSGGSSVEMAIDQNVDDCYKEKNLDK